MSLKSLTYTSLAAFDLTERDVADIHRTAVQLNALEGITGLLIFNGTHFLQVVEGAGHAVDDLIERLRRDPRHDGLEIRDERIVDERMFGDWNMELVRVETSYSEARETLDRVLPDALPEPVSERIHKMTEAISGTVTL